ncbi:hypothetical protein C2E23DRAFT_717077 [Lenzites betulinus]|nr:hypothetical protein C2E23DRAFT_717077 [Lenzites betulinus]
MADEVSVTANVVAEIITGVRDIRSTQLVSFVTATIVIYDYIVCIEREVELIWKKRWSVIKFAFLWHRYFGLLCVMYVADVLSTHPLVSAEVCSFWFYWETWGYCGVLFTSEAVLLLWIYVVYNKNRYILALIGACYVAEVVSVLAILAVSFQNFEANAFRLLGVQYCIITDFPRTFKLLWIPILAYDSLLLLLFLYRGCGSSLGCNRKRTRNHDSLLHMVYRHSLLNFLAIFGTYLSSAIIWLTSPVGLYQIPVSFALALSITNCTRLLLNIRRAYYSGVGDPILFNIRDIPATGANTPNMLDAPMLSASMSASTGTMPLTTPYPMSPISATSGLSGDTLRERSTTPVSARRFVPGTGLRGARARSQSREPASANVLRISIATTSSEMLRQVAPSRCAHEYERAEDADVERDSARVVYVTPDLDPDWWQYELREMRVDPNLSVGEAL